MKNYREFYSKTNTAQLFNNRLKIFVDEYIKYHNTHLHVLKILDIGCGKNTELSNYIIKDDYYFACDFYDKIEAKIGNYTKVDLNKDNLSEIYDNQKFDVIFCGEVIEHLFSPDNLIDEIKKIMHPESILVLSTPNLACYLNRILLFIGISPLYLENSSEVKLGRKFKFLGQHNKTEGHIRLFTYGALIDFFKLKELKIIKIIPTYTWDIYLDKIIRHLSKSLAQNNVFVLKNKVNKMNNY